MQTLAELGIELPKMNMNPYIFVDHKQMMKDQLLSEVSELKEELKNAREENMRNFNGYYYPEMWREHPELAQKFLDEVKIKETIEEERIPTSYSPQELLVMAYCPSFGKEYEKLIQLGYMRKVSDGYLEWLKSKQSLAEYFGNKEVKGKWPDIENLFQQKGLNHLLSVVTSQSKDYKKLKNELGN